ncbi:hypothetical protein [Flavivirga algicola]|nr:hypothetical protein [Flavivirga algicola]
MHELDNSEQGFLNWNLHRGMGSRRLDYGTMWRYKNGFNKEF